MKEMLIAALLLLPSGFAMARDWQVYTHSLGEQAYFADGGLHGKEHAGKRAFYLELVHGLLAELGQPAPISEVPLARGLMLIEKQPYVVLFNLSRTPERLDLVHWVGPTLQETDYLYESRRTPTGIHSLADARDLPVCVLNGSSHDQLLAKQGFRQLKRHTSYAGCFRMLAAGRVRLVASADAGLAQKLREAAVASDEIQASAVSLGQDQGYIALSKSTPANEVVRWQAALQGMRQSGKYQALYRRYAQ